ncbi:transcriptional coactivator p15/PC4 family protein [Sulfitobacter mediterraneus]|uniref:transcriptional coactivator p15/PC4 family protein n=1 Tax=Sulfitobacter mediterraneus TaxID=83219 RepID=UPI0021A92273|nr:transcriptional coactivator p15/PC4 family protein [Sulfitobacter mediterraneus]UWR10948.1 transcriptional coactivator p15/PC4 family protein [Sulfitobacter mediterraneus]
MTVPTIEIRKNSREVIRVTREEFNGHDLVNIRVFFDAGGGVLKPGKQGVAFRAALLPELQAALGSMVAEDTA